MANFFKNVDLFDEEPEDSWRRKYWKDKNKNADEVLKMSKRINSSVETVLVPRDKEKEVKDFYQAQLDITKDVLPKQTMADRQRLDLFDQQEHRNEDFEHSKSSEKMLPTPPDAFIKEYPFGNGNPQSAARNPTSSIFSDEHKGGYRGDDGVPQGKIGTLMLDVKGNSVKWIGDYYLPKETQDNKQDYTPPKIQISSAKDGVKLGCLMAMIPEDSVNKFVDLAKSLISEKDLAADGFETEPHVTILYGFAPNFDPNLLSEEFRNFKSVNFSLGTISRFECPEYDVVKVEVKSLDCHVLNSKIRRDFKNYITTTHPSYNPHLTLAYVKKGTCLNLDGINLKNMHFTVNSLLYSGPDRNPRQNISLGWDAKVFDDGGMQDSFQSEKECNIKSRPLLLNIGEILEKALDKKI